MVACHRGIRHHLGDYLSEEDEIEEIPFIGIFTQEYLNTLLAPTQETESIPEQQEENKTAHNV